MLLATKRTLRIRKYNPVIIFSCLFRSNWYLVARACKKEAKDRCKKTKGTWRFHFSKLTPQAFVQRGSADKSKPNVLPTHAKHEDQEKTEEQKRAGKLARQPATGQQLSEHLQTAAQRSLIYSLLITASTTLLNLISISVQFRSEISSAQFSCQHLQWHPRPRPKPRETHSPPRRHPPQWHTSMHALFAAASPGSHCSTGIVSPHGTPDGQSTHAALAPVAAAATIAAAAPKPTTTTHPSRRVSHSDTHHTHVRMHARYDTLTGDEDDEQARRRQLQGEAAAAAAAPARGHGHHYLDVCVCSWTPGGDRETDRN